MRQLDTGQDFELSMAANLVIRSRADSPELKKAAGSIEHAAWSELGFLNYTRAHYEHYADLLDSYPEYQICLVSEDTGYPVAAASCVPFACSGADDLPPEGWDWVVETAALSKGKSPNVLGALAISVPAVHRFKGYARRMIRELVELADRKGLRGLVAPVRPSAKVNHPWVPLSEYITWTDPNGRMHDPWLRSHLASGGKIVGLAERSMVVHEPLPFWENWSKQRFETSGNYALEGTIAPVKIDVDRQIGTYEEPNVWVAYAA
ncbi:MAG: transferase [Methyloceanibacter sp.]